MVTLVVSSARLITLPGSRNMRSTPRTPLSSARKGSWMTLFAVRPRLPQPAKRSVDNRIEARTPLEAANPIRVLDWLDVNVAAIGCRGGTGLSIFIVK